MATNNKRWGICGANSQKLQPALPSENFQHTESRSVQKEILLNKSNRENIIILSV